MTQEDKQLLLKDLCARLPYRVKVTTINPAAEFGVISGISINGKISVSTKDADIVFECTEVKPYLHPMNSMTEEERKYFQKLAFPYDFVDALNKHHFDYRGLISKGLAIAVTKENNPYK